VIYRVIRLGNPAAPGDLELAAARLLDGELLIHPTSTVYGLGGLPRPDLDEEISRLKGKAPDSPLIRLAASVASLHRALPDLRWGEAAEQLAGAFWPGPLTLVLDDGSTRGLAVRVDPHPAVLALLEKADALMTSTSVNQSGESPVLRSPDVERVVSSFPDAGVAVTFLDGGDLPPSPASTVISLLADGPRILREGAVSADRIEGSLGERLPT
jgi:L-threonylcarbamoyladenylate synthase